MLEYVDHHSAPGNDRGGIGYTLLGDGMGIKERAFRLVQDQLARAA